MLLAAAAICGCSGPGNARDASSAPTTDLGVWSRFVATSWKEYGLDGAVQDVSFELTAPGVVTVTVRADREVRGQSVFRLKGDRTGRVCPVRNGQETCSGSIAYDDRSVTFTFDDPKRLGERAVLVNPGMFVHSRQVEGVAFDVETYASEAFERDPAVRQRARDNMEHYKRAMDEVKRRRAAPIL